MKVISENNNFQLISNAIDRYIYIIVSSFIICLYLLWFIVNVFGINYSLVWYLVIPFSFFIAFHLISNLHIKNEEKYSFRPYIVFFLLLFAVTFYLIEPTIRYPFSTIGIPNKDLHDGIAKYISMFGYPPSDINNLESSDFILSSQNGLYLGYPNVLHVFSAQLIKFGVFEFHATWIAVVISILINSLAMFLLCKHMFKDPFYGAIISALFGVSSYRIAFAVVTSIPMFFSYNLIIPSILIFTVSVHHYKNYWSCILPILTISLISASYSGTITLLLVFIPIYILFIYPRYNPTLSHIINIVLFSIPLLLCTLLLQHNIYWRNTFPTAADFDPYELSQRILLMDKPLYMFVLFFSVMSYIVTVIKNKMFSEQYTIRNTLFILAIITLMAVPYDLIFHLLKATNSETMLVSVNPNGLFGGLNHQRISRLALLQPFFFIFFIGVIFQYFKNRIIRSILIILIILCNLFIKIDLPFYSPIQPELQSSFINEEDREKPYTFLSHFRLVTNNQIWTNGIIEALDYLNRLPTKKMNILLWDHRLWTEQTIQNWGSIYIGRKISTVKEIFGQANTSEMTASLIRTIDSQDWHYIVIINPPADVTENIYSNTRWRNVLRKQNVFLFQIKPLLID